MPTSSSSIAYRSLVAAVEHPGTSKEVAAAIKAALELPGAHVDLVDNYGLTVLNRCASNSEAVKRLLSLGADWSIASNDRNTPIYVAAYWGASSSITELISAGADVNSRGENAATPLFIAAMRGHTDAVRTLLAAGADWHLADRRGRTPEQVLLLNEKAPTEICAMLRAMREREELQAESFLVPPSVGKNYPSAPRRARKV